MIRHQQQDSLKLSGASGQPDALRLRGKRLLDLALAIPAIIITSPLVAVSAVLIRATSAGPAVFTQTRVGKGEKPFRCYKLRTMFCDSPSVPTHEARSSYVTPVGHILRSTKLDELPQLWNVIKGEMSLVGPRPCLPEQADLILHRRQLDVLQLEPGITGLAQIHGIDMSDPLRCAEADADYLKNWSLQLDLTLLLRTLWRRS